MRLPTRKLRDIALLQITNRLQAGILGKITARNTAMVSIYFSSTRSQKLTQLDTPKVGAWVHAVDPSLEELETLAKDFKLDEDLLTDALDIYESPRIERDGSNVYVYTRYSFPAGKEIGTEPLLIIHTRDYLITVMRTPSPLLDRLLGSGSNDVITTQRTKNFLQILTAVNASYERHFHTIGKRILSIRGQLRKTEIRNEDFVDFIDLEEDLNESLSALQAQAVVLRSLLSGKYMRLYEEDKDLIEDLSLGTAELTELAVGRLKTISNTREAYATIMANTLNKTFKKLTSISIFMTIPTITTGLYGMNLALPLARNHNAFWFILLMVMGVTACAIWLFKKLRWL
jgi:magnesium transporter